MSATIREILTQAVRRLEEAGVPDASWDAKELLEWAGGPDRSRLPLAGDEILPDEAAVRFREGLGRRERREPLQQIVGQTWFMGLPFRVNDRVLCPRPDTENLVELALRQAEQTEAPRILDLCCGSGCIGISLAHFLPRASVMLSDISEEALALARENAALNGVRERVSFACGDLLEASLTETGGPLGRFDIICCNPPYIPGAEIGGLMPEVRDHEPRLALDGGEDGLDFYRRLAADLSGRDGKTAPAANAADTAPGDAALPILFLEIGCEQGPAVRRIFEQAGWRRVSVRPDLAGLDRVVVCEP